MLLAVGVLGRDMVEWLSGLSVGELGVCSGSEKLKLDWSLVRRAELGCWLDSIGWMWSG